MSKELRGHVIAARNIFLGVSNFIVLQLPAHWRVLGCIFPVEVDGNKRYGEVLWVTSGSADHVLLNEESGRTLHLWIEVRSGRKLKEPRLSSVFRSGVIKAGLHVHIHDNDGKVDSHTVIGTGSVDWPPNIFEVKRNQLSGDNHD